MMRKRRVVGLLRSLKIALELIMLVLGRRRAIMLPMRTTKAKQYP